MLVQTVSPAGAAISRIVLRRLLSLQQLSLNCSLLPRMLAIFVDSLAPVIVNNKRLWVLLRRKSTSGGQSDCLCLRIDAFLVPTEFHLQVFDLVLQIRQVFLHVVEITYFTAAALVRGGYTAGCDWWDI